MHLRYLCGMLLALLMAGCSTTTVFIVRHAEKVDESDSTNLSPAGRLRAVALANTLANRGIDSIFSTPYRRTRQTAQPLAQRLGLSIISYPASLTGAIVQRVDRIRGKQVLVVGHSNTILDIAKGLGAESTLSTIASGDFDNLFQVRIRRTPFGKSVFLTEKTYGQPTPP